MGEQTFCPLAAATGRDAPALDSWLHPHLGATTTGGPAPREYVVALQHVALTLGVDPRWRSWWRESGLAACELGIVAEGPLDHLRPSADIRRLDDRLQANFTCALPARAPACEDRTELATRTATAEVRAMFEVIRQALTMPALPPTPPVPDLPPDAPDVPLTKRHLPEAPDEPDHLTLARIQEFFT